MLRDSNEELAVHRLPIDIKNDYTLKNILPTLVSTPASVGNLVNMI